MSYQVMKRDFLQEKEVEEGQVAPSGGGRRGRRLGPGLRVALGWALHGPTPPPDPALGRLRFTRRMASSLLELSVHVEGRGQARDTHAHTHAVRQQARSTSVAGVCRKSPGERR